MSKLADAGGCIFMLRIDCLLMLILWLN